MGRKTACSGYSGASPVASVAMSAGLPPTAAADQADDQDDAGEPTAADRARAAEALHRAFTRLSPQGSDSWNFLAAFTHLGDRYGPYHPGASALSDALAADRAEGRRTGPLDRLRPRRDRGGRPAEGEKTDLEEAMGHVVEAFRFLSARVETLEERLAAQDRPVDGAAWLVPARALGPLTGPVASYVSAHTPGGVVLHADCGEGDLLRVLREGGTEAHGVEPRGAVALRALEQG